MQSLDPYAVSQPSVTQRADGPGATMRGPVRELFGLRVPAPAAAHLARVRVRVTHGVPLIASGIRAVLSGSSEFEIIASQPVEASNGAADVLITDIDTGLRALNGAGSHRNVLIVAQDDGEAVIRKALAGGARGFLLHTCGVEELTGAVKAIGRGGSAFAPLVADRMVQSLAFEALTERELEVLHLMVHGYSDKDMARKLVIALGTVKSHVRSILTKLGAARRAEAAVIAQRRGIARLDKPLESITVRRMK